MQLKPTLVNALTLFTCSVHGMCKQSRNLCPDSKTNNPRRYLRTSNHRGA